MNTSTIEHLIEPKIADLGEFSVQRSLPSPARKMVGPFVFFDHMGPAEFPPGAGVAVRPHPHIGIATVTYLFEGEIMHRDSLGIVQPIQPGAVNWMVAGRGIVHSERSKPEHVESGSRLHGIQAWVALPREQEECDPAFFHHPREALPVHEEGGTWMRLIAGEALGMSSPVAGHSSMFYIDVIAQENASQSMPEQHAERALYLVEGSVRLGDQILSPGQMAVVTADPGIEIFALRRSRYMLLGGDAMDGDRTIWWNFVSSDGGRIEQAKRDWRDGRFQAVPGETGFIPLPD